MVDSLRAAPVGHVALTACRRQHRQQASTSSVDVDRAWRGRPAIECAGNAMLVTSIADVRRTMVLGVGGTLFIKRCSRLRSDSARWSHRQVSRARCLERQMLNFVFTRGSDAPVCARGTNLLFFIRAFSGMAKLAHASSNRGHRC